MTRHDVEQYFGEIGRWMKTDIRRGIQLARASWSVPKRVAMRIAGITRGGGSLLAALGLVAYTEATGG